MTFDLFLIIFGLCIFIYYNILFTVFNNDETPESISATSYISRELFDTTAPFTVLCISSAVCLFPLWVAVTPDIYQFLVFLSCMGMLFAGTTPLYKQEFEGKIHYTGGIIAFVCGLIWLILTHCWITLAAIVGLGGLWTIFDRKKYTFIFEFVSYIAVCLAVLTSI